MSIALVYSASCLLHCHYVAALQAALLRGHLHMSRCGLSHCGMRLWVEMMHGEVTEALSEVGVPDVWRLPDECLSVCCKLFVPYSLGCGHALLGVSCTLGSIWIWDLARVQHVCLARHGPRAAWGFICTARTCCHVRQGSLYWAFLLCSA